MKTRVLILGAGASCGAGYPFAANLIDSIRKEATSPCNADVLYREAWDSWDKYRKGTSGIIKSLIYNSNPEVVLSVPDLFAVALKAEDEVKFEEAYKNLQCQPDTALSGYEEYLGSEERIQMQAARTASIHFLECLACFFRRRHIQDFKNPSRRAYLRKLFGALNSGDVVITLNWDTIAERTLCEAGLWNPTDGYGFQKALVYYHSRCKKPKDSPQDFPPSAVKVLKLHGSFGWRIKQEDIGASPAESQIIFSEAEFLQHFPFEHENTNYYVKDPLETSIADLNKLALLYPSFLKRIEMPQLQEIWHAASEALRAADKIDVWGYSLPESDTAVRVLMNGLRFKAQEGGQVTIHDKSSDTLDRWRTFLGEKAIYQCERLA